ncbi:ribosomal protein S5 domain 2-type protein [Globomyces pollinis-pini]|nr:ribosomal protein S5 domain 2-type protein [Globomyces pollinis-pini]
MVKEKEVSNAEREFIHQSIKEGLRNDNRGINDMRRVKIILGPQLGQAQIVLGRTRVIANVSCEIVRPSGSSPTEGSIQFNTEFTSMASPLFEPDRTSELEVNLSRMLEKAMRKSRAIDTEGLCIVAGEKVWSIKVHIRVIDYEGNILDCACLATMAALIHFKRPDVTVQGQDVTIHDVDEKSPISLSVHHIPICITFGFFDNGERHVIDPNWMEEQVQEGDITFVINVHREICTLSKAGGVPISMEKVLQCASIAGVKVAELNKILKDAIAEVILNGSLFF